MQLKYRNYLWEGEKTLWVNEKMLVTSIFFFHTISLYSRVVKSGDCVEKSSLPNDKIEIICRKQNDI